MIAASLVTLWWMADGIVCVSWNDQFSRLGSSSLKSWELTKVHTLVLGLAKSRTSCAIHIDDRPRAENPGLGFDPVTLDFIWNKCLKVERLPYESVTSSTYLRELRSSSSCLTLMAWLFDSGCQSITGVDTRLTSVSVG